MEKEMQLLMSRIAHLGEIGEAQARRIVNDIYKDGLVSRDEAEAMFQLNDQLCEHDPVWVQRFTEAVRDFVLEQNEPEGWVSEQESEWLMEIIGRDGRVEIESEIDLLLEILRHASGAPVALSRYCLEAISRRIVENGVADDKMTERMRRILHAPAGEASIWISRHEANVLFRTNDAIATAPNAKSWDNVFAKAVLNHLLSAAHPAPETEAHAIAREAWLKDNKANVSSFFARMADAFTSGEWFDRISYDAGAAARARGRAMEVAAKGSKPLHINEQKWFLRRLGWDKSVSPAERRLIELLKSEAPGFVLGLMEVTQMTKAA